MARHVVEVEGLKHGGQPIPWAVRMGPLLVTGSISGADPATGAAPADAATEIAQAFDNVDATLEAAGATRDDIAKVSVYLRDLKDRETLNTEWVSRFPSAEDRPVRHTTAEPLPPKYRIKLEVLAFITDRPTDDTSRRSS